MFPMLSVSLSAGSAFAEDLTATTQPTEPKGDTAPAATVPKKTGTAGIGISPNVPQMVGANLSAAQAEQLEPSTATSTSDEWKMDFHGYLRAPMRISYGPTSQVRAISAGDKDPHNNCTGTGDFTCGPGPNQFHSTPRVPGLSYTDWNYTNTTPGPWAQLNFSYGNSRAAMTVVIGSYSLTSAGYRNLQAQQGIDQAFVTVNFPEAFGDVGGLVWNVGAFYNRYGTAGKYDGGMYETYLFGRTRVSGSTLQANLDLGGPLTLTIEQGLGAKLEIQSFANNQVNEVFNVPTPFNDHAMTTTGYGSPYSRDREDLPYQGAAPQGSTFVHHYHVGLAYKKQFVWGAHFLQSYTPDDNWNPQSDNIPNVSDHIARATGPRSGRMTIYGADFRLSGGVLGEGYVGWSHIDAKNILALADAIEVLHSFAGWNFKQNFFGRTYNPHNGDYSGPENESGTVDTIAAQYTFSFGALANYPKNFWGQGPDLAITAFGMLNIVKSKPNGATKLEDGNGNDQDASTKKLKFGLDINYVPLSWLGAGIRGDVVQPDLDGKAHDGGTVGDSGSAKSFKVISPRVVFKTAFVTHETITVQYSRYFLGSNAWATYPYEWAFKADPNLFSIAATMWW